MHKEVILSDGEPCRVRALGLFELDGKSGEVLGPYRYSLLLATGQIVEDTYDIRALDYTPTPPDTPVEEIKEGSQEWDQLKDYETYRAALAHEKERIKSYEQHLESIAAYILENCVSEPDRQRIVTEEDWQKVYQAAFVPQLTEEVIERTLRDTFQGYLWQFGDSVSAASGEPGGG